MGTSLIEMIKRLEAIRDSGKCTGLENVEFFSMDDGARFTITNIEIALGIIEICGEVYN